MTKDDTGWRTERQTFQQRCAESCQPIRLQSKTISGLSILDEIATELAPVLKSQNGFPSALKLNSPSATELRVPQQH